MALWLDYTLALRKPGRIDYDWGAMLLRTVAFFCCVLAGCAPQPETARAPDPNAPVADQLTTAKAADGKYISWREHIIDSVEISGVAISGGDGSVIGDLDGDGFGDIVSVHESDTTYDGEADGHIRVAYGSADPDRWELGTLAEGQEAAAPEDAAIGDLNGDGYPDVVIACELAHLLYLQNPGKDIRKARWERLIPPQTLERGSFIRVFLADFNQDGRLEVVTPNKGGQNPDLQTKEVHPFLVYEIQGDPLDPKSWVEHEIGRARIPINSQPFDLDGDGDLDIMAGSRAELRMMWFENVSKKGGALEFVERRIDIDGTTIPDEKRSKIQPREGHALVTGFNMDYADLNGDGRFDLITQEQSNLVWLEQPADFAQPWKLRLIGTHDPDAMTGLNFADIDGDGDQDVIAGGYSQAPRDHDGEDVTRDGRLGRLAWFENPGDPAEKWTRHDISRRKRGMFDKFLPRDMDGDGDVDFISTRGNSVPYDGVFWLEQVRTEAPVASFARARKEDSEEMPLPSWR